MHVLDDGLRTFLRDESGAVTVDWVVLTAGAVGFAIAVIAIVVGGATDTSTGLGARLSAAETPAIHFE